jgi:hypothetical protein
MDADEAALRQALTDRMLPPTVERWRTVIAAGESVASHETEWAGALVVVERGTLRVECRAGGAQSFRAGSMLALDWLPLRRLCSDGIDMVSLLALRRSVIRDGPIHPFRRSARMKFRTVIELGGKTATGFQVPAAVVEAMGSGKRPPVTVRIGGHTYRSTVAPMGGAFYLPLAAENREAAGVAAGDEVEVEVELDRAPRTVEPPPDLAAALDAEPAARAFFDGLSNSNKKWHVLSVEGARTAETRQRRVEKSVAMLRDGRAR